MIQLITPIIYIKFTLSFNTHISKMTGGDKEGKFIESRNPIFVSILIGPQDLEITTFDSINDQIWPHKIIHAYHGNCVQMMIIRKTYGNVTSVQVHFPSHFFRAAQLNLLQVMIHEHCNVVWYKFDKPSINFISLQQKEHPKKKFYFLSFYK